MSKVSGALAVGAAVVGVGYATTSTTSNTSAVTTQSSTTTTAMSTAATTTTSTTTTPTPAGYTVRAARNFGIMCDGVKDDTVALQNALNSLRDYQALQLPAGSCKISKQLMIYRKSNVAVVGAGKDSTIFRAVDPLHSSFIVFGSTNALIKGFQVHSPNTGDTQRTSDPNSKGFFVAQSSYVTLDGVKANRVAGAGILLLGVHHSNVINSEVLDSHADAFHVTGGSSDFLFQNNVATRAGDDCFASIGYGGAINRGIRIYDNKCYDNLGRYRHGPGGSAVSFEGTVGGQAYRNYGELTGVSGLRVASQKNWNTSAVSDIDFRDNVLVKARQNQNILVGALMVFTTNQSISNVRFSNTVVRDPLVGMGIQLINYVPGTAKISGVSFAGTAMSSADGRLKSCWNLKNMSIPTNFTKSGTTLNGSAC
jgi:hypothetical protein